MRQTRYLLIGGGLASDQAARLIRMKDGEASILLVGREPCLPYDRPPLSKELLRGERKPSELFFGNEASYADARIETVLGHAVTELDADARLARLDGGDEIAFEKALIATGGVPIPLEVPGADLAGIHYLRTLADATAIHDAAGRGRSAVIVGAGFIGMEVASSLAGRGLSVRVIERLERIWPDFVDEGTSRLIQGYCERRGIEFLTDESVVNFTGDDRVRGVVTSSGKELPCDLVCVGIGIRPSVEIAQTAGLQVDDGIVVDEHMETSAPGIFAAGDVVNYPDPVFGRRRRVEHWGHAEYGGQVAGLNMAGTPQAYDMLTYAWSDIFDLHIESAGDAHTRDRTVLRGSTDDASFTVLYLKGDVLTAYFAVNTSSREFPKLQRLIRKRVNLAGRDDALRDPAFELKQLL